MPHPSLKKSTASQKTKFRLKNLQSKKTKEFSKLPSSILMLTTYPPRECGIATYSKDLVHSIHKAYGNSCSIEIGAIYNDKQPLEYAENFPYSLNPQSDESYDDFSSRINMDKSIELVMIQHEFGLFNGYSDTFIKFLKSIEKPLIVAFHTVLPNPDQIMLRHVAAIVSAAQCITVMTKSSKSILINTYNINPSKINLITHGTHLIKHSSQKKLKSKYGLEGKTVLATFGLLGPGKSIETTLDALPEIIQDFPEVLFLILGKTHPTLANKEGETYRNFLVQKTKDLGIEQHVKFVNEFLPLKSLLDYLQLTDIYLFTSIDPNQAVSGTFAYAMSCGCPIISTPMPHAKEFLTENKGLLFDFGNSKMLAKQLRVLLNDPPYRKILGLNALHSSFSTSWENSALAHGQMFQKLAPEIKLEYQKPKLKLDHLFKMTTDVGLIQFSKLNEPDITSGYTLDDNARALIVICEYYKLTRDEKLLPSLITYFRFVSNCLRYDGGFLNYVNEHKEFTDQNESVNLEDSNGRGIWALGHLLEIENLVPQKYAPIFHRAKEILDEFLPNAIQLNSPRAMGFIIKGLAKSGLVKQDTIYYFTVTKLGSKLLKMYNHESQGTWKWFESYLTYGNSVLPEAMLAIYRLTNNEDYKCIAYDSFNFLLQHLFLNDEFKVISNQTWFSKGDSIENCSLGGQQPIDVAYTILALKKFHDIFPNEGYEQKMELAFSWFMGNNHLNQIIYNPCTTGCHDGLELENVNLNQGAESTVSYLLSRLAFEKSC